MSSCDGDPPMWCCTVKKILPFSGLELVLGVPIIGAEDRRLLSSDIWGRLLALWRIAGKLLPKSLRRHWRLNMSLIESVGNWEGPL